MVRRSGKGKDYPLASTYQGEEQRLEYTVGMTPSDGWEEEQPEGYASIKHEMNGHSKPENGDLKISHSESIEVGGEEVYMAGDDGDDAGRKPDPAVYRSAQDEEDDGDNCSLTRRRGINFRLC